MTSLTTSFRASPFIVKIKLARGNFEHLANMLHATCMQKSKLIHALCGYIFMTNRSRTKNWFLTYSCVLPWTLPSIFGSSYAHQYYCWQNFEYIGYNCFKYYNSMMLSLQKEAFVTSGAKKSRELNQAERFSLNIKWFIMNKAMLLGIKLITCETFIQYWLKRNALTIKGIVCDMWCKNV